jgi:uncharacterized protein YbjT (DUF2867 family)
VRIYVVIGATGNTGRIVADNLLAKKEKVRVVGRDAKRLERFTQNGAEAFVANVTDAAALTKAFSGSTAAYILIPPNSGAPDFYTYQQRVSDAFVAAIQKNGVQHVVALSSIGADKPGRTGPVVGLHDLEQKLSTITGLSALFLRAVYFMENLLPQAGVIQSMGTVAGPLRGDLPVAMIATRDIGAAAAASLATLDFTGKSTRELQGPRDVTYVEAAKIIGNAIGKADLGYFQAPPAQLKPALMSMGMSSNMADLLLELAEALNTGYMKPLEPRSPENTTPTTLETFVAEEFVPAYRGKAAGAQS